MRRHRLLLLGLVTLLIGTFVVSLAGLGISAAATPRSPQAISVGIASPVNGSIQPSTSVPFSGTSTPGATLQLIIDSGTPIVVTADASGAWSSTATGLAPGSHIARLDGERSRPSLLYWASLQSGAGNDLVYVTDPTVSGTPIATIAVNQDAVGVTAARDGSKVYISTETGLDVVDTTTNTIVRQIDLQGYTHLGSLTPDGRELWVAQRDFGRVARIDTATDAVLGFIPLGAGVKPHDVTFRPDGRYAYTGDTQIESTTVTVIDVTTHAVAATLATGDNNRRVLVNDAGTRLYVAATGSGRVEVFDPRPGTPTLVASVSVGSVEDIVLSGDQTRLYVSSPDAPSIQAIDTATNTRVLAETISGAMTDVRDLAIDPWSDTGIIFGGSATYGNVYDLATRSAIPGRRTDTPNGFRIYDSDWARRLETASATVSFTVDPSSDLATTKTHPGNFVVGQPGVYTISVVNTGPAPAALPLTIADLLPTGLVPTAATFPGGSCAISGQNVTCTRTTGAVPAGTTLVATITVDVTPAAAGTVVNRACARSANDDVPLNDCSDDPTIITSQADLETRKTHAGTFVVGLPGTYTIRVVNHGPSPAAGPITVTDTLPAGLSYVSAIGATCSATGQIVTCIRAGGLAAGASSSIQLTVQVGPAAAGNVVNRACARSATADPDGTNDCADDPTIVVIQSDLSVVKTSDPIFVVGKTGTYTLTVTNHGPSPAAPPITVTDDLPPSLVLLSVGGPDTACTGTVTISCTISATLMPGDSRAIRVQVTVLNTAAPRVTNSARVIGSSTDPDPGNNTSTVTTPVLVPELAIRKAATPPDGAFVSAGAIITYTLDVTNTGTLSLTQVLVSDAIPLATTYLTDSARPSPTDGPSPLVWTIPTLLPGERARVSFAVRVQPIGTTTAIRNMATTRSDQTPPTDSNEIAHPFDPTAVELTSLTATRQPWGIDVRWETARELDTAGFTVLLGVTPNRDDAIRHNQHLIPAQGSASVGVAYDYPIESRIWLQPEHLYVWLEETDTAGATHLYGPVDLTPYRARLPIIIR